MKYLILMCKGFIVGIAKIIPGVSGAIIAISFGIYERLINILSKPLKIKKDDLKFLFFLLIGAALGIALLCKGVKWCLNVYYLSTMLLFVGLIIGGVPEVVKIVKKDRIGFIHVIIFIITFFILYYFINLSNQNSADINNNYIPFFIGIVESATTIIPGISGTAIFMALGWYDSLLTIFENLAMFQINMSIFLFLGGYILSTIIISKLISFLFKHYKSFAYTGVLGFMCSSIFVMLNDAFNYNFSLLELNIGICLLVIGMVITNKINLFFSKL